MRAISAIVVMLTLFTAGCESTTVSPTVIPPTSVRPVPTETPNVWDSRAELAVWVDNDQARGSATLEGDAAAAAIRVDLSGGAANLRGPDFDPPLTISAARVRYRWLNKEPNAVLFVTPYLRPSVLNAYLDVPKLFYIESHLSKLPYSVSFASLDVSVAGTHGAITARSVVEVDRISPIQYRRWTRDAIAPERAVVRERGARIRDVGHALALRFRTCQGRHDSQRSDARGWFYGGHRELSQSANSFRLHQERMGARKGESRRTADSAALVGHRTSRPGQKSALRGRTCPLRLRIGALRVRTGTLRPPTGTLRLRTGPLRQRTGTLRFQTGPLPARIGTLRLQPGSQRKRIGTLRARIGALCMRICALSE